MENDRQFVKFNTILFNGKPFPTIRINKLSSDSPSLLVLLQEDLTFNRFNVLKSEICDNSLENKIQLLLKYPLTTNFIEYKGSDMQQVKDTFDLYLEDGLFFGEITHSNIT